MKVNKLVETMPLSSADSTIDKESRNLGEARSAEKILLASSWKRRIGPTTSLIESFYHAFNGIRRGLKTERNLRIHFFMAFIVIAAGVVLKLESSQWLMLFQAISFVLAVEFINTALEHLVDLAANTVYHRSAKAAKDSAAAAVLIASSFAVLMGSTIFGPKILALLHLLNNPRP